MKKFIALMLMVVIAMFSFAACGNKNEQPAEEPPTEVTEPEPEPTDPVAGNTYEVTSYDFGQGMKETTAEDKFGKIVFGEDGTVQDIYYDANMTEHIGEGTYEINGNTVKTSLEDDGQPYSIELTIDGDTLTNTEEKDGVKYITVYTKSENTESATDDASAAE